MSLKRKPPAGNVRRVAAIGSNLRGTLTNKAGRIVQFESFAERSLLLRLERDPSVRDYASQPETFHSDDVARYTPDFLVCKQDGSMEIHEVTRSERRKRESHQSREQLAVAICQARGWCYVVHTEDNLPQGHELSNLLSLVRYRPTMYRAKVPSAFWHMGQCPSPGWRGCWSAKPVRSNRKSLRVCAMLCGMGASRRTGSSPSFHRRASRFRHRFGCRI